MSLDVPKLPTAEEARKESLSGMTADMTETLEKLGDRITKVSPHARNITFTFPGLSEEERKKVIQILENPPYRYDVECTKGLKNSPDPREHADYWTISW